MSGDEMAPGGKPPRCDYFAHGADIGIVGRGESVEGAFEAAAEAMFAVMADPARVTGDEVAIEFSFEESDREFALVRWLNGLLAAAREAGAILRVFTLRRTGERWNGRARGPRWHDAHERGTEVKGATLTMLAVTRTPQGWEARCVVDV